MSATEYHAFEDLPGASDPAVAAEARDRIMVRHLLTPGRAANDPSAIDDREDPSP